MKTLSTSRETLQASWLIVLSVVIGIVGGFGALLFRAMIGLVHNLFFYGHINSHYNTNLHASTSAWGLGFIVVPVIGGLIVTWLTQTFAPEAKGHGVPEVMNAIYFQSGKIRPVVAIVKSIASAISIGTGGSVGREGPIIQIGAACGSTLGQWIDMPVRQRNILIAAGAGAGIAATFNAPLGGIAFAIELMLVSVNAFNLTLVTLATVIATIIGRLVDGVLPAFNVPALAVTNLHMIPWSTLLLFIPFGVLIGLTSALFIRAIYWTEDCFNQIANPYLRAILGMTTLGLLLLVLMHQFNHYYIDGVGYSTILDILKGLLTDPAFLLLLACCKLVATSLTLGSGASGGVFSPSLFIGATLGAAFGSILNQLFPALGIHPVLFTIAGMAGMVGGTTGAVITAIVMLFEQTRDYQDILPVMLTVAIAYAVRYRIMPESIYTLKLARRGQRLPQGLQANIVATRRAKDVMEKCFDLLAIEDPDQPDIPHRSSSAPYTILQHQGNITGVINYHGEVFFRESKNPKQHQCVHLVSELTSWPAVLRKMQTNMEDIVIVMTLPFTQKAEHIVGIITEHEIAKAARQTVELI